MKLLMAALLVLLTFLQWRLWFGDGGIREIRGYRQEVVALAAQLERSDDANQALAAEVADLKKGLGEIEARARAELGMIREDETFYQFVGERALQTDSTLATRQPRNLPVRDAGVER